MTWFFFNQIFGPKSFGSQNFLEPKFFWSIGFFCTKTFFEPKFLTTFFCQNICLPYFFIQNFYWTQKYLLDQRNFLTNIFGIKVFFGYKPYYFVMQHRLKCTWEWCLTLALALLVVVLVVVDIVVVIIIVFAGVHIGFRYGQLKFDWHFMRLLLLLLLILLLLMLLLWQSLLLLITLYCQAQPKPQPANPQLGAEIALFSKLWGTYTLYQHHTPGIVVLPYYRNCWDLFMTR